MKIFVYDRTFDGLLSAVFDAYSLKSFPDALLSESDSFPLFYDDSHVVVTEQEKFVRVWNCLEKKLSDSALRCLTQSWLSELPEVGMLIFRYICKTINTSHSIETNFSDSDVLALARIWKKVNWERIRLMQFVRFQKTADGTFFAVVEPEFNALPIAVQHFKDRFADQKWLIYDLRRDYGFYYNLRELTEFTFEEKDNSQTPHLVHAMLDGKLLDENELLFQRLWQTYFKATCIQERLNPKKHRQDMPVRYWKYLTEKQTFRISTK